MQKPYAPFTDTDTMWAAFDAIPRITHDDIRNHTPAYAEWQKAMDAWRARMAQVEAAANHAANRAQHQHDAAAEANRQSGSARAAEHAAARVTKPGASGNLGGAVLLDDPRQGGHPYQGPGGDTHDVVLRGIAQKVFERFHATAAEAAPAPAPAPAAPAPAPTAQVAATKGKTRAV